MFAAAQPCCIAGTVLLPEHSVGTLESFQNETVSHNQNNLPKPGLPLTHACAGCCDRNPYLEAIW